MSNITFPDPTDLSPGATWKNPETGVEYFWNGSRWIIVDTSEAIDLQKVLENGNVADKDIYLAKIDKSSDIIDISPEKAKIIIATEGSKVPVFELQHYDVASNSQVKLELDEFGKRFDIECDEKVDNIHFRFEEEDKLILTKHGAAVFSGIVSVGFNEMDPQESHAVPFGYYDEGQAAQNEDINNLQGSVTLLQKEIEALSNVVNKSVPHRLIRRGDDAQNLLRDGGMYFGDCPNGNILDVPDDWSGICFIYIDTKDNDGNFADFGPDTLDPGDLIEGISSTGYFLVEVGDGGYDEGAGKKIAGIEASLLKARGVPGEAGTEYALTAFRLNSSGGIDLPTADDRYIKKTGDTMSGLFKIDVPRGENPSNSFLLMGSVLNENGELEKKPILKDYKPQSSGMYSSSIYYYGGIEDDASLVNLGYLNDNFFQLNEKNETTEPIFIRPTYIDDQGNESKRGGASQGNMLVVNQESNTGSIVRVQQEGQDVLKIEYSRDYNLYNNRVKNVADPADGDGGKKDAANRQYVDGHVKKAGANKVEDGWKIESETKTHFHVDGDQTKIYWLADPSHDKHPVTRGYANANYLDKTGDTMTGRLDVTRPGAANNEYVFSVEGTNLPSGQKTAFRVLGSGKVKAGHDTSNPFIATDANDVITKKALEDYVGSQIRRLWTWTGDQSTSPGKGKFSFASSGAGYLYFDSRPDVGTRLYSNRNSYLSQGGDSLDGDKEFGFAPFSIWRWDQVQLWWEPVMSGHMSSTGLRTGKNTEAWRFSSNKNTIRVLESLSKTEYYTICIPGTILS